MDFASSTLVYGSKHRHLQDLGTLLFAAGETVVQVSAGECRVHMQLGHLFGEFLAKLLASASTQSRWAWRCRLRNRALGLVGVSTHRVTACRKKFAMLTPGIAVRVLERQEQAGLGALV